MQISAAIGDTRQREERLQDNQEPLVFMAMSAGIQSRAVCIFPSALGEGGGNCPISGGKGAKGRGKQELTASGKLEPACSYIPGVGPWRLNSCYHWR